VALAGLFAAAEQARAAPPSAAERSLVRTAETAMRKAANFYRAGKYRESAEAVQEADASLARLPKDPSPELTALVTPVARQAARARELLAAQGIKVHVPGAPLGEGNAGTSAGPASGEAVQFARDVAPLLLANCMECHGDQNPSAGFSLYSFERLLAGGGRGAPVAAGKAAESLLVKKLRGTADGDRMPQGGDPLPGEAMAKIEAWITAGAKFDGDNRNSPLEEVVARYAASQLTHEQLAEQRRAQAEKTWRLILPDVEAHQEQGQSVLVVGGVVPERLAEVARTADEQAAKLRRQFNVPDHQPLVKGRLTLFVFEKRYDYGEVGTMLEKREIPTTWQGHWSYTPRDAYACLHLPAGAEVPAGLVTQLLSGAYAASLGKVPRWFAEGSARAVAARLHPKDPRLGAWDEQLVEVLKRVDEPAGFLTASLPPEESDLLSYSFVGRHLMLSPRQFSALVAELQAGGDFDAAFAKAYRGAPSEQVAKWLARVAKR
jgi:hypothetical protein